MAAGEVTRRAACQCGALSITVAGDPVGVGVCHCLACQRRTGSVFATLATFAAPWTVTGEATRYRRTGDAGGSFTFFFCPTCGTSLFHVEDGARDHVSVAVGGFGDPSFPPPEVSVYDGRRHRWVVLTDGVARFERDPV